MDERGPGSLAEPLDRRRRQRSHVAQPPDLRLAHELDRVLRKPLPLHRTLEHTLEQRERPVHGGLPDALGFPDASAGTIRITIKCEQNECLLEVADDGIGLPDDFNVENATSLGLKLVSVLSKQLHGDFQVLRSEGLQVRVLFPQTNREQSVPRS